MLSESVRARLRALERRAVQINPPGCWLCSGDDPLLTEGPDGQVRRVLPDERGELHRAGATGPGWTRDARGIWTCPVCGGKPIHLHLDAADPAVPGGRLWHLGCGAALLQRSADGKRLMETIVALDFEAFLHGDGPEPGPAADPPEPVEAGT